MRNAKLMVAAFAVSTMMVPATAMAVEKIRGTEIVLPEPNEETGQIIFFRPSGTGGAVACSVHENGEKVSSLGGGRYFIMDTTPGRHEFTVKTEASDSIALEVESGERQWVSCKIKMGFFVGRPDLRPSSEEEFRTRKKYALVDDDDMGPAPGAMSSAEVAAALAGDEAADAAEEVVEEAVEEALEAAEEATAE